MGVFLAAALSVTCSSSQSVTSGGVDAGIDGSGGIEDGASVDASGDGPLNEGAVADASGDASADAPAGCANEATDAIASTATPVPVAQAADLQKLLDLHGSVRLDPDGDYSAAPPITIHSGQRIYGIRSQLPSITFAPGTSGAVISGVNPSAIVFDGGDGGAAVASQNCIKMVFGSQVSARGATLEDNLFLDLSNTTVAIDTSTGGHLRNNRFIRTMTHAASPALTLHGDAARQSWGNTFLWTNMLTPIADSIVIDNQADVSFVAIDAESWNWNCAGSFPAMMNVASTGALRVAAASGGDNATGACHPMPYFDVDADEFTLTGAENFWPLQNPGTRLGKDVQRASMIHVPDRGVSDQAPAGDLRVRAFIDGATTMQVDGVDVATQVPSAAVQATLRQMFVNPTRTGEPWERPMFPPIADPAGPSWNVDLASKPDDAPALQNLVATNGIARLEARAYYLSAPIKLKNGQGLVGAGQGKTVLIAKDPTIDLIVGDDHLQSIMSVTSYVLADLTLQGGANGIHHSKDGSGGGAQVNLMFLSHVTIRDMSNAGVFVDQIYAWDNNLVDEVSFYRCKTGIKQYVDPGYTGGEAPGMAYFDKNVFYRNQFVECGQALDLHAVRASNLNAFVDCSFRDNSGGVADMFDWISTVFANSEFVDNGGNPALSNNYTFTVINGDFRADALGVSMLGTNAICNGCTLARGTSTTATVLGGSADALFFDTTARGMPLGTLTSGLVVNSSFSEDPTFSQQGVLVRNGQPIVFLTGAPVPAPQLLFGSKWH